MKQHDWRPLYFFDQVNAGLQIHAKVHHLPHDALLGVLLLLQHKHEMVKELLQPLVRKVDTELLKPVIL